jgi:hypothetical protein
MTTVDGRMRGMREGVDKLVQSVLVQTEFVQSESVQRELVQGELA